MSGTFILNKKKTEKYLFRLFALFILTSCLALSFFSCSYHYYKLAQNLNPEDAEFFAKVRYIITKEEERIFLDLPDSEKEKFKEEFWKRRDPDPYTEENEFKTEYFNRIERANELFFGEGKEGYWTDRGRIYVLFGPPMDRIVHPLGYSYLGRCSEIWYYGSFPVIFVDPSCTGTYRLVTYNLSPISSLNIAYMQELNRAQASSQYTIQGEKIFFNFTWHVKSTLVNAERIEGIIFIEVPMTNIWLKEKENKLETTLELHLKLIDAEDYLVWEYKNSYKVEIDETDLEANEENNFKIEVPFVLEKDVDKLFKGQNKLFATLKNKTGGDEQKKVLGLTFKVRN